MWSELPLSPWPALPRQSDFVCRRFLHHLSAAGASDKLGLNQDRDSSSQNFSTGTTSASGRSSGKNNRPSSTSTTRLAPGWCPSANRPTSCQRRYPSGPTRSGSVLEASSTRRGSRRFAHCQSRANSAERHRCAAATRVAAAGTAEVDFFDPELVEHLGDHV